MRWLMRKVKVKGYVKIKDQLCSRAHVIEDQLCSRAHITTHQVRKEFSLYQLSSAPTLTKPLLLLLLPQLLLALLNHRCLLR